MLNHLLSYSDNRDYGYQWDYDHTGQMRLASHSDGRYDKEKDQLFPRILGRLFGSVELGICIIFDVTVSVLLPFTCYAWSTV
jgi:hypothetical protein